MNDWPVPDRGPEVVGLKYRAATDDVTQQMTSKNARRAIQGVPFSPTPLREKAGLGAISSGPLAPSDPSIIKEGEPDESWHYDEHDLNCFAFCLSCKTITGDMHDEEGVHIKESSVHQYANMLAEVLALMLGHPNMKPRGGPTPTVLP